MDRLPRRVTANVAAIGARPATGEGWFLGAFQGVLASIPGVWEHRFLDSSRADFKLAPRKVEFSNHISTKMIYGGWQQLRACRDENFQTGEFVAATNRS